MNDLIAVPNCGGADIWGTPDPDGNPMASFFIGRDGTVPFPTIDAAVQFVVDQKKALSEIKRKPSGPSR
jgi:hypothetical protein